MQQLKQSKGPSSHQEQGQVLVQVPLKVPFAEEIGGKVRSQLKELWWGQTCLLKVLGPEQVLVPLKVPSEAGIGGKVLIQLLGLSWVQLLTLMGQELGQVLVPVPWQVPFEAKIGEKEQTQLKELT